VHVGDFTNLHYDGYPSAVDSLEEMTPHLKTLADRGEFVYVFGNRDERPDDYLKPHHMPVGTYVPQKGITEVGDLAFIQDPSTISSVDKPLVRLTHYPKETPPRYNGLLSLSGHTHAGRVVSNIVDTGFLYRTGERGAREINGCYATVEADTDGSVDVTFHSLGPVEARTCRRHSLLGERFVVPSNWRNQCGYCYEESEYFDELREAVHRALVLQRGETVAEGDEGISISITEEIIDTVEDAFQRPFREYERVALVNQQRDETEQAGLSDF